MNATKPKGPTREQLTDQQWAAVCNVFNTIARIVRKNQAAVMALRAEALGRG